MCHLNMYNKIILSNPNFHSNYTINKKKIWQTKATKETTDKEIFFQNLLRQPIKSYIKAHHSFILCCFDPLYQGSFFMFYSLHSFRQYLLYEVVFNMCDSRGKGFSSLLFHIIDDCIRYQNIMKNQDFLLQLSSLHNYWYSNMVLENLF